MYLQVSLNVGNFWSGWATVGFSRIQLQGVSPRDPKLYCNKGNREAFKF
jgi:hypothetical protein